MANKPWLLESPSRQLGDRPVGAEVDESLPPNALPGTAEISRATDIEITVLFIFAGEGAW